MFIYNVQVINVTILFFHFTLICFENSKAMIDVSVTTSLSSLGWHRQLNLSSYSPYSSCIKLKTFVQKNNHSYSLQAVCLNYIDPSFTGFKSIWGWNPFGHKPRLFTVPAFGMEAKPKKPKTKIRDLQLRWDMDDPREKSPVLDS